MKIKDLNLSDAQNWLDTAEEMLARYKNKILDDVNTFNCRMCRTAMFIGKVTLSKFCCTSLYEFNRTICIHCILYDEEKNERCTERLPDLKTLCQEINLKDAGSWIIKGAMINHRIIFYIELIKALEEHIETLKNEKK
jgi:hypothetical protein